MKGLKKNVSLAKFTTYKIGGPADYFIGVKNYQELKNALKFADDNTLPIFILAGGSNVLFSDKGYRGMVIKIENCDLKIDGNKIEAGAGILVNNLVSKTIEMGLAGLEWAGGLPGTLGGAIRGNAGCFGGETKDTIKEVIVVTRSGEVKTYSNADCHFGYRDSIFKHNNEIILNASLTLEPGVREKLKYEVFDHIKYRAMRHEVPSCGSVFKNCPVQIIPSDVLTMFKDKIKIDPFEILPVAVLLSAVGLNGKIIGGAKISQEHSNIIVNFNNAKLLDILELIYLAKEKVKNNFNVELEEEVELVGFE